MSGKEPGCEMRGDRRAHNYLTAMAAATPVPLKEGRPSRTLSCSDGCQWAGPGWQLEARREERGLRMSRLRSQIQFL